MAGYDKFIAGERIAELRAKRIRSIYFDGATLSVVPLDGPITPLHVENANTRRLLDWILEAMDMAGMDLPNYDE